ncbi:MAG: hypothetical protein LBT53_07670 [Puniceicoccales bacterium]|nr:hypothetical protein [Puniceicoccales bacterium]
MEGKVIFPKASDGALGLRGAIELAEVPKKRARTTSLTAGLWEKVTASAKRERTEAERDKADLDAYGDDKKRQSQSFEINSTGTFRILNVLLGKYTLSIHRGDVISTQTFTVPPQPRRRIILKTAVESGVLRNLLRHLHFVALFEAPTGAPSQNHQAQLPQHLLAILPL